MEETIQLRFTPDEAFFSEMERRFEALAKRASQQFAQAGRAAGGASGGGSISGLAGNVPGGGGGAQAGLVGQALGAIGGGGGFQALDPLGIIRGAGAGIRQTPAASASDPNVLAKNGFLSGAQAGLENTVGRLPIVGDFVMAQFNSVKEAMEVPTERAVSRLKSQYGTLAASGYQADEGEMREAAQFAIQIERNRYKGERAIEKVTRQIEARDSLSFGISFLGR